MKYSLFIDDERDPGLRTPPAGHKWVVVRTVPDAQRYINAVGWPHFISFDHDLGENQPTGHDFAKWIVETDIDTKCLPVGFTFDVHSQNVPGSQNINGLLTGYLEHKKAQGTK